MDLIRHSGRGYFLRHSSSYPTDLCWIGIEQLGRNLNRSTGRGKFASVPELKPRIRSCKLGNGDAHTLQGW